MKLIVDFGGSLCYVSNFYINDVPADEEDFGSHYDHDAENAEPYCCADMRFGKIPPTDEVLAKYKITASEYDEVCEKLYEGLSFGNCGWCE